MGSMVRRTSKSPSGAGPAGLPGGVGPDGCGPSGPPGAGVVLDDEVRGFVRTLSVSLARGDLSLADDIEQETLLVALQRRPASEGALRSWLRSVARFSQRSVLGRGRRHGNHVYYDASIHDGAADGSGEGAAGRAARLNPVELGSRREVGLAIDRALDRLPDRYGRVIRMRVLEGMPPRAIAAELDVPVNTVRTWTRRAFEQLREDADCITMERAERSRFGVVGAALLRFARSRALWMAAAPVAVIAALWWGDANGDLPTQATASAPGVAAAEPEHVEIAAAKPQRSAVDQGSPQGAVISRDRTPVATGSQTVHVTVVDESGRPVPGAELYSHAGWNGAVERAAVTGADGTATVRSGSGAAWVAARGPVGLLSESILLGQPYVSASASLTLRLRRVPVQWIDVDRSARPDLTGPLRIEGIPEDPRLLAQESPLGGIRGASCWVPAWDDRSGRFGVMTGDLRKYLAVWDGTGQVALAGPVTIANGAPDRIALRRPWSVTGRLVMADGQPVKNARLRLASGLSSAGNGRHGYAFDALTNQRGEFEIPHLVGDSVSIGARGLSSQTIERPDGDSIDVGTLALDQHVDEVGLAGRVLGASGPFTVQAVTSDWRRGGISIHFARTRGPEDSVTTNPRGEFELQLGAAGVRSILVTSHPRGDEIPPTWIDMPAGGWGTTAIEIDVDPRGVAHLRGELSDALTPGWVQFVHAGIGHRVEGVFEDGTAQFRSPALSAGLWRIEGFDREGQLCRLAEVKVKGGVDLDLGVLVPEVGKLDVAWPAVMDSWSGLHLTIFKDGALWFQRRVSPSELRAEYSHMRLSVGRYGFEVRGPGSLWGGEGEVRANELTVLSLGADRRVPRAGAR